MEQTNQPRGDADKITRQQHTEPAQQPVPTDVPVYQADALGQRPPVTFAEAEAHDPFSLLTELHDHALTYDFHGERPHEAAHHLAELALSAAVVVWWSRWQPITMHRAFLAGASLTEVAEAAGTTEAETHARWSEWIDRQTKLHAETGLGVAPNEAAAIRARLGLIDSAAS